MKLKNNIFIKFQIVFFSSRHNGNVRYFGWNVRFCCNFISNAFLKYLWTIKVYNKVAPTDSKNQTYEKKLNSIKTPKYFAFMSENLSKIGEEITSVCFVCWQIVVLHEIYRRKSEVTNNYVTLLYLQRWL